MSNKTKGWLKSVLILVTGTVLSLASARGANAFERASDADLAKQKGAARWTNGQCSSLVTDALCNPTPAEVTAPNCGTCTGARCGSPDPRDSAYEGDRYQDSRFSYRYCTGVVQATKAGSTCQSDDPYIYVTLHRYVHVLSGSLGCNSEVRPGSPFVMCYRDYCWDRPNTTATWQGHDPLG